MAEPEKNTLIEELLRIDKLYRKSCELKRNRDTLTLHCKMNLKAAEENVTNAARSIQTAEAKAFGVPTPRPASAAGLEAPPEKQEYKASVSRTALVGIICLASLVLSFGISAIPIIGATSMLAVVLFICAIVTGIIWFLNSESVNQYIEWKEKSEAWDKNAAACPENGEQERFLQECGAYENRFFEIVEKCDKRWQDEFKEKLEKALENASEENRAYSKQLFAESDENRAQLDAVTLIDPKMFDKAGRIAGMLRTGRADTLKEAINLTLDEIRKDEEEEARREEAARQEAILQQQAEEAEAHHRRMERQAEEDRRAREWAERDYEKAQRTYDRTGASSDRIKMEQAKARMYRGN